MKVNVVTQVTINSTASNTFKYLTDLHFTRLWNPQITKLTDKKQLKLGSTYETTSQVLGVTIESVNQVTKFVRDKEIQIENETGLVHYKANFCLKPQSKNSISLICDTEVASEAKAFAFSAPVMKMLARRELQTDLQALKLAVEQQLE